MTTTNPKSSADKLPVIFLLDLHDDAGFYGMHAHSTGQAKASLPDRFADRARVVGIRFLVPDKVKRIS